MKELRVKLGQVELQVRDSEGKSEAIIFLHFSGANLMMWQRVLPYFHEHYRMILVDLRGHGKSDVPESGYHMDVMAQDLIGIMDQLGIEKAHLLGSSLGAEVGLSLAANHPERVLSLILDGAMNSEYGSYGLWEGTLEEFEQHVSEQLQKIRNSPEITFPTLEAFMENRQAMYEKYGWWNSFVEEMERYGARKLYNGSYTKGFGKASNATYMGNYYHYCFEEYYPKVECPILMLANKEIEGREKEVILGLKALAPRTQIAEIDGWEHPYLWMLDPEKACSSIVRFLDQVSEAL